MKVLLINPPAENLVQTFAPEALTEEMGFYPPMGLLYVAAGVTQAHGGRFPLEVLDTQVERMDYAQIERHIQENRPDVVGISSMTFLLLDSLKVARIVKKIDPGIHVVIGGAHPSIYPEEIASQPDIDSIVMGEGEHAFLRAIRDPEDRKLYLLFRSGRTPREVAHLLGRRVRDMKEARERLVSRLEEQLLN